MALSTSEFVADSRSASSIGGASDARLVLVPASGPDVGAWLVEARLAASPDIVQRGLFVLETVRMLMCLDRITLGKQRARYTFVPESQSGLHFLHLPNLLMSFTSCRSSYDKVVRLNI